MTLLHPMHKHTRQIAQWHRQDVIWAVLKALPVVVIAVPVAAYLATVTIEKTAHEAVNYQPCYLKGC